MSSNKFYLTTPIYYVNARPHIGHAYTTIVADVLARRHRLLGDETFFLTGTDEHGQKIERSAAAANIPPQQFADQVSASFEALWKRMGITNNDYIRTTEPRHIAGAQKLFSELYARDKIYLASYTGSYCVSDEAFIDAPIGTPCPDCGRLLEEVTEENFFFKLSEFQQQLIELIEDGPFGEEPKLKITPDSARNEVLSFIRGNVEDREAIKSTVARMSTAETVSFYENAKGDLSSVRFSATGEPYVPGALKDLSISRSSFTWGIPVPEPAASEAKQPHVIYVWLDALANYMTALGYGSDDETLWEKFWPADLHLVGKEITRFHCVYWPAFLLAAGLPTPKQITANGWLLFDNSKMSKSKGNIVRTETILDAFGTLCPPPPATPLLLDSTGLQSGESEAKGDGALAPGTTLPPEPTAADRDLFAADILRYYLLREIPFGQDGSFSFEALITRYNADLANGYGNLVSRTLSMVRQYFSSTEAAGKVAFTAELPKLEDLDLVEFTKQISEVSFIEEAIRNIGSELSLGSFLEECSRIVAITDGFITSTAPWKIAKSADEEARKNLVVVLYTAAESIRIITALLYPILPYATARVWAQLGLGDIELAAANGELKNLQWGGLQPGTKLGPLAPIFPRAPKELAQIMIENEEKLATGNSKLETVSQTPATTAPDAGPRTASLDEPSGTLPVAGSSAHTTGPDPSVPPPVPAAEAPAGPADASPQITIDDFIKIELRVAQVVVCERIPKADKLLRLEVDFGYERRQILSGIAEWYTPEDMVGRRIIVITNLAPRKMRGLESHGMLLAASEEGGKPFLATVPEGVPVGTRLK